MHLFVKLFIELIFLWLLNKRQQYQHHASGFFLPDIFYVPEQYLCTVGETEHFACSQDAIIPCWVSRPFEKTVKFLAVFAFQKGYRMSQVKAPVFATLMWNNVVSQ